jgi:phosphohistidine phosphatase
MAQAKKRAPSARPRELLVVRHAKSAWDTDARTDFDRPLKKRGRRDAPRMGRWLEEKKLRPDLVVASPAKRARQTTMGMLGEMNLDEDAVRWEPRIYGAEVPDLLDVLGEIPRSAKRVMLVGHNPGLEDLVLRLGGDSVKIPEDGKLLPTATVARLRMPTDWGKLRPGAAKLVSITRPKELPKE